MVNLEWNGKKSIRFDSKLSIGTNLSLELVEYINSPLNDKIIRKSAIENKKEWDNILILGDNKLAIELLLKRFENKINLIYFDPPFA
ncbi:MAG: hypothetical protein ACFE85_14220, partial [Candidatus Hodarchaeota archaeon]